MRTQICLIGAIILALVPGLDHAQEKKKNNVSQAEWGMMLTSTDLFENGPDAYLSNDKVLKLLEGRPDKRISVDDFKKAIGNPQLVYDEDKQKMILTVVDPSATVFYYLAVPSKGKTTLKAGIKGGSQYWTFGSKPTVITRYQVVEDEVEVGDVYFKRAGIKRLGISIPKSGILDSLELETGCSTPIIPGGGWDPQRQLTNHDMAQTIMQTLNWGKRLPFQKNAAPIKLTCKKEPKGKGGIGGYDVDYEAYDIRDAGFHSFVSDKKIEKEQTFIIDGCLKEKVFPSREKEEPSEKTEEKYNILATVYFARGGHALTVNWGINSCPGTMFLKRRDDSYDVVRKILEEKGFVLGASGDPVTPDVARSNIDNINRHLEEEPSIPDVEEPRPGVEEEDL